MDFGIRELLILIGAIFFIAIVADAVRRFLENRKKQIKLLVKPGANQNIEEDNIDWYAGELPAGGARSRSKEEKERDRERESQGRNSSSEPANERHHHKNQNIKAGSRFTEPFDILMASEKNKQTAVKTNLYEEERPEPVINIQNFSEDEDLQISIQDDDDQEENQSVDYRNQKPAYVENPSLQQKRVAEPVAERVASQSVSKNKAKNQWDLFNKDHAESDLLVTETNKHLPEEVISINVMAKGGSEINGADLLSALLAFGLRFGDMNIFHRHELSSGQGAVIFSMASALNPGTFDLESMPQMQFKGVTFFMRLSQIKKRVFVLELMLDIAKRLANQLNAELKDDTHSVLSSQTVSHYKTRIQEYERRYLGQVLRNDN